MDLIVDFEKLYYHPSLPNRKGNDIVISAHKDRVGFFVIQGGGGSYIISSYGTIDVGCTEKLEYLYIQRLKKTIEVSCKYIIGSYYRLYTNHSLEHGDFMSFKPEFSIEKDKIYGPYLDNIIGIWVAEKMSEQYPNIVTFQSIDEEASLQYSIKKNEYKVAIIVDTIQQDYVEESLDLDRIYTVTATSFTKLNIYESEDINPLELKVGFVLEPDIIKAGKKYFLLCPIEGGHVEKSGVRIGTVTKLLSAVTDIIENESL